MDIVQDEDLRRRLVDAGYANTRRLPNTSDPTRWVNVANNCSFTDPELNEIINDVFPPQQGKS